MLIFMFTMTICFILDELIKVLACLDALTRHNSISTSVRRQVFLAGLSLLQV